MKHVYYPDVKGLDSLALGLEGSAKMMVKPIPDDLFCLEIAPGGHTPDHQHGDRERLIVMSGEGEIKLGEERKRIKPGDFMEFGMDEQHQVYNDGRETLMLMCFRNV